MALTTTQVSQLYITLFGRASDGNGNTYWMTNQPNMTSTANVMLDTDAAKTYFGTTLNDNQAFIEHIYLNTLNKTYAQDKTGIDYWVAELDSGKSQGEVVDALIVAAKHFSNISAAQDLFNNKVEVSDYTASKIAEYTNLETFQGFIDGVTDKSATIATAKSAIDLEANFTTGVLSDGLIKDATIFADANGDGVWNPGEAKTTTDHLGNFSLEGTEGTLVATGGTDISTGLAFEGTFTAPAGSTVITPITSLVAQVLQAGTTNSKTGEKLTATEAAALVAKALGLSSDIDLLAFDPIAVAADATASAAKQTAAVNLQAASVQVANMMGQAAAMLDGAGIASEEGGAVSAAAALANMIVEASASETGAVDLTSAATVDTFLQKSAAKADATPEQLKAVEAVREDIAIATANVNDVMADAAANPEKGANAKDIFTQLAQTQVAAEDIENMVESGAKTGDAASAAAGSDGAAFKDAIDGAADEVAAAEQAAEKEAKAATDPEPDPTPTPDTDDGGGGVVTPPPPETFTVINTGGVLTFDGTATGAMTIVMDDSTHATFTRGTKSTASTNLKAAGVDDVANVTEIDDPNDAISITAAVADDLISNGTAFNTENAVTVTEVASASSGEVAAITDYTTAKVGGSSVTLDAADDTWSLRVSDLTTALDAGIKFAAGDAVDVRGLAFGADAEAAAITDYTTAKVGGSSVTLDAADDTWSLRATEMTTALAAGIKFAAGDAVTVTAVATDGEAAAITDYTKALVGGKSVTLDATDDAWSLTATEMTTALAAGIKFSDGDAVTVTAVASNGETAAITDYTKALVGGGKGVTLDATDDAWSLTAAEMTTALAAGIKFSDGDAVTVTEITDYTKAKVTVTKGARAISAEAAAITAYTTAKVGGSSVTLDAADNTWSLRASDMTTALAAGIKFAAGDAVTVTEITNNTKSKVTVTKIASASSDEAAAITDYTKALVGGKSVTLDAADNTWSLSATEMTTALAAGIKFAAGDTVLVTAVATDGEAAAITDYTQALVGGKSVTLDAADNTWSLTATEMTTALAAGIKFADGDAVTVTDITDNTTAKVTVTKDGPISGEAAAIKDYTTAKVGGKSVTLDATDDTWSLRTYEMTNALDNGIKFAAGDAVTVTAVATDGEAAAITDYTQALVGGKSVTLDAADNTWSLSAADAGKIMAAGIKIAIADSVTYDFSTVTTATGTILQDATLGALAGPQDIIKLGAVTGHAAGSTASIVDVAGIENTVDQLVVDTYEALLVGLGNYSGNNQNKHNYAIATDTGALMFDADGDWATGSVTLFIVGVESGTLDPVNIAFAAEE